MRVIFLCRLITSRVFHRLSCIRITIDSALTILYAALAAFFAVALLYSSYCAFVNFMFGTSGDYIRYTNMIWNSGHGDWFRFGARQYTYLATHLAFSLALLGPLFRIVDHPFLLSAVQWAMITAGGLILVWVGRRRDVPTYQLLAVLVFWFGYPFTQSVQLCEFHSTSVYMLLLPALYAALCFRRGVLWLLIPLLLGLREEAGIYAIPLLAYVAYRERWRAGWLWSALCAAYVVFAVLYLFPAINGASLLAHRHEVFHEEPLTQWIVFEHWRPRFVALGWALLPVTILWRRGWRTILAFVTLPLMTNLFSSWRYQYTLDIHYPANVMACLAIAIVEIWSQKDDAPSLHRAGKRWASSFLVAATLFAHRVNGYVWTARHDNGGVYWRMNQEGMHGLKVARTMIPMKGVLTAERRLGAFVANRADLTYHSLVSPDEPRKVPVDLAFSKVSQLSAPYWNALRSNQWGVIYFDLKYVVLGRHAPTDQNDALLRQEENPKLSLGYTRHECGENIFVPGTGYVRYWPGDEADRLFPIALGAERTLDAGNYRIRVDFRTDPGSVAGENGVHVGEFILNDTQSGQHIVKVPISYAPEKNLRSQEIDVSLPEARRIEFQVMGGEVPIWLYKAVFVRTE